MTNLNATIAFFIDITFSCLFYLTKYVEAILVPIHFQKNSKDIFHYPQPDLSRTFKDIKPLLGGGRVVSCKKARLKARF